MIKSPGRIVLLLFVVFVFASAMSFNQVNFKGVVTDISESSFSVEAEDDEGEIITRDFLVTEETKVFIGDQEAAYSDMEVDDLVSVSYKDGDEGFIAVKIVINR